MIRSTWTGLVPADEGNYTVFDPAPAWDEGLPLADVSFDLARVNGFIGQGAPWAAYVITGTRFGLVRLTVEVHKGPVALEGEWSEVVECQFVSHSGTLRLVEWGGEHVATLEGLLTPGPWGLRACARGRDEAANREWTRDDEPVEEHLFQFWPGPHQGAVILTTDAIGATMRGETQPWARELPPPPTAEEIAEVERLAELEAREREKRWEDDMYWGGVRPSERLRAVGGSSLVGVDRPLLDALAEAEPESLRAIARWTARRAYDAAGLSSLEWVAPALAALDRGEALPPPFDDWGQAWARLLGKDPVIENVHVRADNSPGLEFPPHINPEAAALPAIFAAADADPLRAALGAVDAAIVTLGNDYPRLLQDLRDAFPEVR